MTLEVSLQGCVRFSRGATSWLDSHCDTHTFSFVVFLKGDNPPWGVQLEVSGTGRSLGTHPSSSLKVEPLTSGSISKSTGPRVNALQAGQVSLTQRGWSQKGKSQWRIRCVRAKMLVISWQTRVYHAEGHGSRLPLCQGAQRAAGEATSNSNRWARGARSAPGLTTRTSGPSEPQFLHL